MPLLVVVVLVAIVHLATGITAWSGVGLLADDHEMIGMAILRHRGDLTLASAFLPPEAAEATRALYRPFIDLVFWLEYPWFGIEAFGYHVVNSVMHCGTAVMWGVLVRRLSGSLMAGLAAAVLFAGWPGHSEVTHWIAARTNVQSVFFMTAAVLLHDFALTAVGNAARRLLPLVLAAVLAVVAVGTKESAVFVLPMSAALSWVRSEGGFARRLLCAGPTLVPLTAAVVGWLWWRASRLGTWGSGSHYGWRLERIDATACLDWLRALLAPVHLGFLSSFWLWLLLALHVGLLALAAAALRHRPARRVAAVACALILVGYAACIGLEKLHVDVLQNIRYSYEPVLGLTALLAVGVATLPGRWRGTMLAAVVLVHAVVIDGNRESWLRAAAVYRRMHHEVVMLAKTTGQPVRVFDAPGVYEGAFAYLNGYTEFLFWQQTAAPGTALRGAVSSTQQWRAVLRQLAAAAAADRPLDACVVQWDDGALVPYDLDRQWPAEPFAGVEISYARLARRHPFVGSEVPVHVLVRSSRPLELWVLDTSVAVEPGDAPQAVELQVPLPEDRADGAVHLELRVRAAGGERSFDLGSVSPQPR